jgi:DNA uptake protein ComE-like DNA-binding protein
MKAEDLAREQQLRDVLDRIAAAEQRATDAEERARATVVRIEEEPEDVIEEAPSSTPAAEEEPSSSAPSLPAEPPSPPEPEPRAFVPEATEPAASEQAGPGPSSAEPINLNTANYEQLRSLKLSVTQTGRILSYRERSGGFSSLDELESIPGFSKAFLDDLRGRLRLD